MDYAKNRQNGMRTSTKLIIVLCGIGTMVLDQAGANAAVIDDPWFVGSLAYTRARNVSIADTDSAPDDWSGPAQSPRGVTYLPEASSFSSVQGGVTASAVASLPRMSLGVATSAPVSAVGDAPLVQFGAGARSEAIILDIIRFDFGGDETLTFNMNVDVHASINNATMEVDLDLYKCADINCDPFEGRQVFNIFSRSFTDSVDGVFTSDFITVERDVSYYLDFRFEALSSMWNGTDEDGDSYVRGLNTTALSFNLPENAMFTSASGALGTAVTSVPSPATIEILLPSLMSFVALRRRGRRYSSLATV